MPRLKFLLAPLVLGLALAGCTRKPASAPPAHRYLELADRQGERLLTRPLNEPEMRHYRVGLVLEPDDDSWYRMTEDERAELARVARASGEALPFVLQIERPGEDEAAPPLSGDLEPWRALQARHQWDAILLATGKQLAARPQGREKEQAAVQTRVDLLLFDAWHEQVLWRRHGVSHIPLPEIERASGDVLDGAARAGWREATDRLDGRAPEPEPDSGRHRRHHRRDAPDDDGDEIEPAEAFWLAYLGINLLGWFWEIFSHH